MRSGRPPFFCKTVDIFRKIEYTYVRILLKSKIYTVLNINKEAQLLCVESSVLPVPPRQHQSC